MRTPAVRILRVGPLLFILDRVIAGYRDATSPPAVPEPNSLANVRYSIWKADSYAGDGVVRFHWDATRFCDWRPPAVNGVHALRPHREQLTNTGRQLRGRDSLGGWDAFVFPSGTRNASFETCALAWTGAVLFDN